MNLVAMQFLYGKRKIGVAYKALCDLAPASPSILT